MARGPRPASASAGLADRLLAEGAVRADAHAKALAMERRTGKRIEECLLELGAIEEADLLRRLAALHNTRFVTTEKLAQASIPSSTLAKVACKVAERYGVVPIVFDEATNTLSIATADPDNFEALDQARKGAGARDIVALVARPAAVEAAIRKFYHRDALGFSAFQRHGGGEFEIGSRVSASGGDAYGAFDSLTLEIATDTLTSHQASPKPAAGNARYAYDPPPASTGTRGAAPPPPKTSGPAGARAKPPPPPPVRGNGNRAPKLPTVSHAVKGKDKPFSDLGSLPAAPNPDASSARGEADPHPEPPARPVEGSGGRPAEPPRHATNDAREHAARDFSLDDSFLETLNVLVTLIETGRAELRGHSAQVARHIRKAAERLGFSAADVRALAAAAYIHDLGKGGSFHMTALNVAEYDEPRSAAQKAYSNPTRLLQNLHLAPLTTSSVLSMYERFDGTGLPDKKAGKDIPTGGRLLAIVDTFVDLTANPKNPFGRALKPTEACDALMRYKETLFDPALIDLVRVTAAGDDLRARLLADRPVALLIDPDPEETIVLELRMLESGFDVRVARNVEQALKLLETGEVEVVVAELELGGSTDDGLSLLARARKAEWGRSLPWLVLSRRQGRADAEAAFAHGVIDFVTKPTAAEVLVAKLKQALANPSTERAQRGVAGSLSDMGVADLVQILFYGRKSGVLRLRHGADAGDLYFAQGMIVDAMWGNLRGEEAFYIILRLRQGEFSFDPSGRTESPTIDISPETMLLEGLRRMDEA